MTSFHEELTNARKAAGLTQTQLAKQLHVSRQTVSHWENGRMTPDGESAAKLRQLLPLAAEAPSTADEETPPAPAAKQMPGWLWLCILGAACLALILTVRAILPPARPVEVTAPAVVETEAPAATSAPVLPADYPLEWYQNPPANDDPTKAYVDVVPHRTEARLMGTDASDDPGWRIGFDVAERNGIDFHTEKMTLIQFAPEGWVYSTEVIAARELVEYVDADLNQSNPYFEWQTMSYDYEAGWYGLAVEGVDANGNPLAFGDVIRLVNEPEPLPVKADFLVEQVPLKGKPHLTIAAREGEVIPLVPGGDPYSGEPAYAFTQLVTNTGDAPLTITSYQVAYYLGDELYFHSDSAGESFARWCGESSATIQPGQMWVMDTFEPDSPMDLLCYRIVGMTEDGEEMSFVGHLRLTKEAQP